MRSLRQHLQALARVGGVEALAAAAFAWVVTAALVSRHTALTDVDGPYHVRLAAIYLREGVRLDMPWMTCSITQESWADQHFLFHLLLAPFTAFVDGDTLARWAGPAMAALPAAAAALYLRAAGVRARWLFVAALLLASWPFLLRLLSARAIGFSVTCLIASLACIERRRDGALFAVTYGYTLGYQFAVVVPALALVDALVSREGAGRFRGFLAAGLGVALGLTLNPFFPATWDYLFAHVLPYLTASATHRNAARYTTPGSEWWPLGAGLFVQALGAPIALVVAGVLGRRTNPTPADGDAPERPPPAPRDVAALAAGALVFTVATIAARRFVEYAVPLNVLLAARLAVGAPLHRGAPRAVAAAALALVGAWNLRTLDATAFGYDPGALRGASVWIARNSPPGAVVFHGDWADFAGLFFHNTRNRYIYGLDPYFFSTWNFDRFVLYRALWAGLVPDPVTTIQQDFGSRLVLLRGRAEEDPLVARLRADPRVAVGYRDAGAIVLVLRP